MDSLGERLAQAGSSCTHEMISSTDIPHMSLRRDALQLGRCALRSPWKAPQKLRRRPSCMCKYLCHFLLAQRLARSTSPSCHAAAPWPPRALWICWMDPSAPTAYGTSAPSSESTYLCGDCGAENRLKVRGAAAGVRGDAPPFRFRALRWLRGGRAGQSGGCERAVCGGRRALRPPPAGAPRCRRSVCLPSRGAAPTLLRARARPRGGAGATWPHPAPRKPRIPPAIAPHAAGACAGER